MRYGTLAVPLAVFLLTAPAAFAAEASSNDAITASRFGLSIDGVNIADEPETEPSDLQADQGGATPPQQSQGVIAPPSAQTIRNGDGGGQDNSDRRN
jgi:hypothetical protein